MDTKKNISRGKNVLTCWSILDVILLEDHYYVSWHATRRAIDVTGEGSTVDRVYSWQI